MKYGKYKIRKYAMIKLLIIVVALIIITGIILGGIYLIKNSINNKNNKDENISIYNDNNVEDLIAKKSAAASSSDKDSKKIQDEVNSPEEIAIVNANNKKAVELAGGEETGNLKRRVTYVEEIKGQKYYVVQVYEVITNNEKLPNQMLTVEWIYVNIDNNKTYKKDIMTNELISN